MKQIRTLLILTVCVLLGLTVSCKKNKKTFTVTFVNGEAKEVVEVNENELVTPVQVEEKEYYLFVGWKLNDKLFDFNTPITSDIELVADFKPDLEITGSDTLNDGKSVTLTVKSETIKNLSVEWSIEDGSIASFLNTKKSSCRIEADKPGSTIVTATLKKDESIKAEFKITVLGNDFTIDYELNAEDTPLLPADAAKEFNTGNLPMDLPILEKEHWIFLGWGVNGGTDPITKLELCDAIKADLVLSPIWTYPHIDVALADNSSVIKVNGTKDVQISNTTIPDYLWKQGVEWTTSNGNISVDENGTITGLKPGQADVICTLKANPEIMITLGITVLEEEFTMSQVMNDLLAGQNPVIVPENIYVYTEITYQHTLIGSVSNYLFDTINMHENIKPIGENRPGTKFPKYYICVHDTGDNTHSAEEWSNIVYSNRIGKAHYDCSYQYVVDELGVYHNIPDDEVAWHAGDGTHHPYHLNATGVYGTNKHPEVTIDEEGWWCLDGKRTKVKAPLNDVDKTILKTEDITEMGIRVVQGAQNEYFIGDTYYSSGRGAYRKISNYGGNCNSIGIESCIQQGTDIYRTWQNLAKLVAKLVLDNGLTIDDVVGHNFFSGKNCPGTMLNNNKWLHFKNLVSFEIKMQQYERAGYKFSMKSNDHEFLDDTGRIVKLPRYAKNVSYTITVEKDGVSESVICHSIIQGTACIE